MSSRSVIRLAGVAALVLSACGGTSYIATSSPSPAASPMVDVATVTAAETQEMALTTSSGLTLYYLTSDVAATPKCAGTCLTHWPPLLSAGSPTGMAGVSGTLTVVQNANGNQVAYNGHLLYEFASDKAAGDTKGEGIQAFGGVWHVATPTLAAKPRY